MLDWGCWSCCAHTARPGRGWRRGSGLAERGGGARRAAADVVHLFEEMLMSCLA
ncbi:hypothetical protein ACP70R_023935 [Stipagrostis hirtigluma subsp. patula]